MKSPLERAAKAVYLSRTPVAPGCEHLVEQIVPPKSDFDEARRVLEAALLDREELALAIKYGELREFKWGEPGGYVCADCGKRPNQRRHSYECDLKSNVRQANAVAAYLLDEENNEQADN